MCYLTLQIFVLNAITIVMDILWCLTMSHIWEGQPAKNPANWAAFSKIRKITLALSWINVLIKCAACGISAMVMKGK